MARWLSSTEAAARLGVKPPTLYAYVSRGQLRRRTGPDGRRSEYHPGDVATLAVRGRRARPMRSSDVLIPTAVTEIGPDGPRYRGAPAVELAGASSFEATADHLWGEAATAPWQAPASGGRGAPPVGDERPRGSLDVGQRLLEVAVANRAADPLGRDLRPEVVVQTGRRLLTAFATAFSSPPSVSAGESLAARLAAGLSGRAAGDRGAAALVDAALVLLADHELAASTLAARVAASARADPYAVVLAGLTVLSGPRHGAASRPLERALRAVRDGRDPATALAEERSPDGVAPGFGHPLYPAGDPRATRLLALLAQTPLAARLDPLHAVVDVAEQRGLPPANIDAALAGLTVALDLPVGSGEAIFAVARTAGWIAHAIEQYAELRLLRPTAVYTGVRADDPPMATP